MDTFNIILFGLEFIGLMVYFIFMYTVRKYRDRAPFNSPFFKIMFVIGIVDISRQIEENLFSKFPQFALFGMNKVVATMPYFFAKFHTIFAYYFGHAQVIGVLLVAINRVSVCAFLRNWTESQLRMTFAALWGVPLIFNIPLWQNEFYFSDNGTNGKAILYWKNTELRFSYLVMCAILCSGVAIASGSCYVVVVVKAKQVQKDAAPAKKPDEQKSAENKKLIFIGVVLAVHVGFCGFACAMWATATDAATMAALLPLVILNGDLLNWVNPFLLLACSKAVRKHFKAVVMCRDVNDVTPCKT